MSALEVLGGAYACGVALMLAGSATTSDVYDPKRWSLHVLIAFTWPAGLLVVVASLVCARFSAGPDDTPREP